MLPSFPFLSLLPQYPFAFAARCLSGRLLAHSKRKDRGGVCEEKGGARQFALLVFTNTFLAGVARTYTTERACEKESGERGKQSAWCGLHVPAEQQQRGRRCDKSAEEGPPKEAFFTPVVLAAWRGPTRIEVGGWGMLANKQSRWALSSLCVCVPVYRMSPSIPQTLLFGWPIGLGTKKRHARQLYRQIAFFYALFLLLYLF